VSNLSVNTITDASGGSTASINGLTPQASNMQPFNRIINGAMTIDQRNAGAAVTPTNGQYTLDRWRALQSVASKYSVQQSSTVPSGFKNSLLVTSLSSYSVGAADYFVIEQRLEGFNTSDLAWGTASAAAVTLSFWVRSSLSGTFGGAIRNSAADRSYPFTYVINAGNTWEQKTITIVGDTSGTWLTDSGVSLDVKFGLGVGTTYSGTAGAWAGTNYLSATGATSVVGTSGATFYITGVQLEAGSTASPFAHENYGTTLRKCYRYYYRRTSISTGDVISNMSAQSTTSAWGKILDLPVTQRASGTCNYSAASGFTLYPANGSGGVACTGITGLTADANAIYVTGGLNGSSGLVAGFCSVLLMNSTSTWIDSSAEL
jgi:hypothetical protein